MSAEDLSGISLRELFRLEAETQTQVLTSGLLALERDPGAVDPLDACLRAAHSLKGAARIVDLESAVRLAHAMEDCFVAIRDGRLAIGAGEIDRLLAATDAFAQLAAVSDETDMAAADGPDLEACVVALQASTTSASPAAAATHGSPARPDAPGADVRQAAGPDEEPSARVLRVTAESLNRLLALAGESLVESRWIRPFADSLLRLKRTHRDCSRSIDVLREALAGERLDARTQAALADAQRLTSDCERALAERLVELEEFDRRSLNLSHRMYDEAAVCRMRPFIDGVHPHPRSVRDLAQALGKRARLEIAGEATLVDRDILAGLDAPLGHLLRNAVDHGLEPPAERQTGGKPAEGLVRLEARHSGGALQIRVSDDGRGIDLARIRQGAIDRRLITPETAHNLSDDELLEFLFLPGFTLADRVTEVSGRGVGLDVVRDMIRQVRGTVRVSTRPGRGTQFLLQLPVTLSVVRTLLADIGGEPYAFPLASIVRTLRIDAGSVRRLEGREYVDCDGRSVGLVAGHQVFGLQARPAAAEDLSIIVLGGDAQCYGVVVDRFRGERELVVQPLDRHLGRIRCVSAGALMEDGAPVLIVDAEDAITAIARIASGGRLAPIAAGVAVGTEKRPKRVLVVDDSLTVRELERKLLRNRGYDVDVAVDGLDGWHAVRAGPFDLVVTDVDMPRMDGIELVRLINADPVLKSVPVMIVSYKDRDEDRRRGLDAGAAYYLTKGGFQDETLLQAVVDLIGEAA
jgi:two-component system sensor histidine kinase and response regulator WspE